MVDKSGEQKVPRRRGRKSDPSDRKSKEQQVHERNSKKNSDVNGNGDISSKGIDIDTALQFKPHKSLLIHLTDETPTWHECGRHTLGRDDTIFSDPQETSGSNSSSNNSYELASKYRLLADAIYKTEIQIFTNGTGNGSSDERWVESTMKRGTLKDRVAAMSVVVSANPFHKLYALDGLLQLAGCSENSKQTNSRVAQMAADALLDLFLNTMMPSSRKLYGLEQRPLHRYTSEQKNLSPRILLLWRYEEMLKQKYEMFIRKYLDYTLRDGVELTKIFAIRTAGTLLRSLPENEAQLLSMMVNKLGDPIKKIAAAAGHEVRRVLEQHPIMQIVVAREVQQLSYRPKLSPRALYNCIIFLNQLKLEKVEDTVAVTKNKEDDNSDDEDSDMKNGKHIPPTTSLPASLINTYFRLFEVAVKHKNQETTSSTGDGMNGRLLSALLTGVNRAHPYLPAKDKQMEAHIDSLYRIVHTAPPSACTQALMLLFHLAVGSKDETPTNATATPSASMTSEEKARQDRFYRALYASLGRSALLSAGKHLTMYFNLLYKALKYDTDSVRVIAFAKRLLCTTMNCNPPVVAGSFFLLNEVMKYHPTLKSCLDDVFEKDADDSMVVLDPTKRDPRSALVQFDDEKDKDSKKSPARAPLWEVSLVAQHFHPSVSKFATNLGNIKYGGDPLRDFGIGPFLDKFAYRNPKSAKSVAQHYKRGESVAERRSGTDGRIEAAMSMPMNDPAFIEKKNVNEQEEFFQKFFIERARRDDVKGIHRGKDGDAADKESAEREALEEAENMEADKINFEEEFDDTDSDEERFVNKLAMGLMESSGEGKVNFDDEDPDMDGWSDINDEDNDVSNKKLDNDNKATDDAAVDPALGAGGTDSESYEENSESDDEVEKGNGSNGDDDAFMDAFDDESESDRDVNTGDADSDWGDRVDEDLALAVNESSEEEEEAEAVDKKKKGGKQNVSDSFVDASEYEEMINKSWNDRKRPNRVADLEEGDDKNADFEPVSAKKAKKGSKKVKKGQRKH